MLVANDRTQQRIVGWKANKCDGPFTCPGCGEEVLLRKGDIKIHHFAHKSDRECGYGTGESEIHRSAKIGIFSELEERGIPAILEAQIPEQRADVLAIIHGQIVAVEVQVSSLPISEIYRRTVLYAQKKIAVLWCVCEPIPTQSIRTTVWQRYLHTLYFGRVYYHCWNDIVLPIHFGASYGYSVDETGYYGDRTYYHKTIKRPERARVIKLSDGETFQSHERKSWKYASSGTEIHIPSSKIWLDKLPRWWSNE